MANEFPILSGLLQSDLDAAGFSILDLSGLSFNSSSSGLTFWNTADEVTNYERARILWSGNVFTIDLSRSGTGVARTLAFTLTNNASSGTPALVAIRPTLAQSGTAGYTGLLVDVTEGSTGSGSKVLLDLQVGGVSRFYVAANGNLQIGDSTSTAELAVVFQQGDSAVGDVVSSLTWQAKNAAAALTSYCGIKAKILDPTAVLERGDLLLQTSQGVSGLTTNLRLNGNGYTSLPSGQALHLYNTADEETNYERLELKVASNVFTLATEKGGTGTGRTLAFTVAGNTASSGTVDLVEIRPTSAQSGTAIYNALTVDLQESSVGDGTSCILNLQKDSTPYLRVGRVGRTLLRSPMFSIAHDAGTFSTDDDAQKSSNNFSIVPTATSLELWFFERDAAADCGLWSFLFDGSEAVWKIWTDALGSETQVLRMVRDASSFAYLYTIFDAGSVLVGNDATYTKTPLARFHVYEGTMGSLVRVLESESTLGDNVVEYLRHGDCQTTDATATTLMSLTLSASKTYLVEARIVARRTGGSAGAAEDGAGYFVAGTFKTSGGVATLIGALTAIHTAEDQAAWVATLDTSGTAVRVRVTGAANNNITWHCALRYAIVGT